VPRDGAVRISCEQFDWTYLARTGAVTPCARLSRIAPALAARGISKCQYPAAHFEIMSRTGDRYSLSFRRQSTCDLLISPRCARCFMLVLRRVQRDVRRRRRRGQSPGLRVPIDQYRKSTDRRHAPLECVAKGWRRSFLSLMKAVDA